MSLFCTTVIDGNPYAIFNLKERDKYFHAKRGITAKAQALLTYISTYCKPIIAAASLTPIEVSRIVTGNQKTSPKKTLSAYARCLKEYIEQYLLKNINSKNIKRYKHKIDYLAIDFEVFAYEWESLNNALPTLYCTTGRRGLISKDDARLTAKSLFYLETHNKIEDLWNTDMIPASITMLRLYIDDIYHEAVPYTKIEDAATGKEVSLTGLRRGFLEKQVSSASANLTNRNDAELLNMAYEWSCNAVHYGSIPPSFEVDWIMMKATQIVAILFANPATMHSDFQTYLKGRYRKNTYNVSW